MQHDDLIPFLDWLTAAAKGPFEYSNLNGKWGFYLKMEPVDKPKMTQYARNWYASAKGVELEPSKFEGLVNEVFTKVRNEHLYPPLF
jgi:hypothetical protein